MKKLLLILLAALSVNAANITWLGTTASAKTAANWVGGVLPAEGDVWILSSTNNNVLTVDSNFTNAGISTDLTYTATVSLQSYTVTSTGNIDLGGATLAAATSTLGLTGAAAQSVTSRGESWNNITINRSTAGTCTFADAPNATGTVTVSATNTQVISWSGFVLTTGANLTLDGSGQHNFGTGVTLTGASSNFHIGSTLTAPTATSCAVTFNGTTGCVKDDDEGTTFLSLTLGANALLTNSGGATSNFASTAPLTFVNGGTLTINRRIDFRLTGTGNIWTVMAGSPTINGTASPFYYMLHNIAAQVMSIPAMTIGGTGTHTFLMNAYSGGPAVTENMTGDLTFASTNTLIIKTGHTAPGTFNTGGFSILGYPALQSGSDQALANFNTVNLDASTIQISSYTITTGSVAANCNLNLQTAQITCTGDITFWTNNVLNPGSAIVRMTPGAGVTSTLTTAEKHFANFRIVGNATGTVALSGTLYCDSAFVDSTGKFTQGANVIYARDYTNVSPHLATMGANVNITRNFYRTAALVTRTAGSIILDTTLSTHLFTAGGDSIGPVVARWIQFQDSARIASITTPAADSCVFTLKSGAGLRLATVADSSLNGTTARLNYFVSSTPSTKARLWIPADYTATNTSWTDIQSNNAITITECSAFISNCTKIYFPTIAPVSYAASPWIDTVGKTATHGITITGCSLGKDSITNITALPTGYTINKTTGLISWDGTGTTTVTGNYVIRAYSNAKTDSASVTVSMTIISSGSKKRKSKLMYKIYE